MFQPLNLLNVPFSFYLLYSNMKSMNLLHSYNLTVVGHGFDYFDLKLTDTWCCASYKFFLCVCYNYHYFYMMIPPFYSFC
jgi:hypothetical protein